MSTRPKLDRLDRRDHVYYLSGDVLGPLVRAGRECRLEETPGTPCPRVRMSN